jgi:hypothetical protein
MALRSKWQCALQIISVALSHHVLFHGRCNMHLYSPSRGLESVLFAAMRCM